ncbi:DUF819 domain-containing protein [Hyphococcus luteus]|uniref:DUF819 domain-containing protein n=1 Tax=Hyphococcus luteus TaxID=2058213 RepID=A0A2S7K0L6_9PROT|nr:DUF819 family protein [Marinicaulis flavus]PQA86063.1 hypothetical protein CW354_16950 [Marinicaulis flavus]
MIAADNIFGLLAILLTLSALAAALEGTAFGKRISGVGLILIAAIAASHFGIIPRSAPVYGAIWSYLVPLAIALFLIKADLIKVFREGGRVLIAFLAGMAGTAVGAVIAALFLDLGPDEAKLAGVFSATYTGGSLNFVAVAEAVRLDNASELAAALAIDNILGVGFIIMMNLAAAWALLHRAFPWRVESIWGEPDTAEGAQPEPLQLANLLTSLAVAAVVVAVSEWLARALGLANYSLLFITTLMAAVATFGRRFAAKLRGEDIVAMIFMYLFFAIIGAGADINAMLNAAPGLFVMVAVIFVTHLVFLVAAGALFKLNYAELVVASLACVAGPPIAAAIAIVLKWRNLVAPGVLTGILGYVLGNFVGVGIFTLLGGASS